MRSRGEGLPCAPLTWKSLVTVWIYSYQEIRMNVWLTRYILKLRFSFSSTGEKIHFLWSLLCSKQQLDDSTAPSFTGLHRGAQSISVRLYIIKQRPASVAACTLHTVASQSNPQTVAERTCCFVFFFNVRSLRSALGDSFCSLDAIDPEFFFFLFIKRALLLFS